MKAFAYINQIISWVVNPRKGLKNTRKLTWNDIESKINTKELNVDEFNFNLFNQINLNQF